VPQHSADQGDGEAGAADADVGELLEASELEVEGKVRGDLVEPLRTVDGRGAERLPGDRGPRPLAHLRCMPTATAATNAAISAATPRIVRLFMMISFLPRLRPKEA
jgi:hypothetical protein